VAGLLTACFVAVCSHPHPIQAPLNIAKQEAGTNGTIYWGISHKYVRIMVK